MEGKDDTLFHYTDVDGYNAIRSQPVWVFKASQPPGKRPFGAYFTTLGPGTTLLARRLGLPKQKIEYVFAFNGSANLISLRGSRGKIVLYCRENYQVEQDRQVDSGPMTEVAERLQ
jgi:hypothetical protein